MQTPDGQVVPALIVEIGDEGVVLDANHPLAGEDLCFSVEVTDVRKATAEDVEHGHAHCPGGHQH